MGGYAIRLKYRKDSGQMNINSSATNPYTLQENTYILFEKAQAKAAIWKKLTGKEIINEAKENGEFIHMMHPESTQRLGFMMEFFRVSFNSPNGFESTVKNLSEKYAELQDELMERYANYQDELYKHLGFLNQAFEKALQNTVLLPGIQKLPSNDSGFIISTMPQSVQDSIKQEWQDCENVNNSMQLLKQSISRYLDTFFETFINNIQSMDFDTAFANSITFSELVRRELAGLTGFERISTEKANNVNPDDEESELISKDYFWGIWTLIYSCGKVEIITEKQMEEDPEARRKVNEPVSGGFPVTASSTGTKTTSPSISV
jgi:hypothetical protein